MSYWGTFGRVQVGVLSFGYDFVFRIVHTKALTAVGYNPHDILKTDAAIRSPNLTCKGFTMSPGNPYILGSKGQGHE